MSAPEPTLLIDASGTFDGFVLVTDDDARRTVALVPRADWTGPECIANAERLATGWEGGCSLAEYQDGRVTLPAAEVERLRAIERAAQAVVAADAAGSAFASGGPNLILDALDSLAATLEPR